MKNKIRPIYSQLQGYLSQAPKGDVPMFHDDDAISNQYNQTIDELNEITSKDYGRFKVKSNPDNYGDVRSSYIVPLSYRTNISGLISRLHGEYFSDEPPPFSGMPSTVINTTQNQNLSVQIEIVMEIVELIADKIKQYEEGSKERTFLEQVKEGVKKSKGAIDLINLILSTATSLGLATDAVLKIFSK
jgi:hypothetical protein